MYIILSEYFDVKSLVAIRAWRKAGFPVE